MDLTFTQTFLSTVFIISIGTLVLVGAGFFAGVGLERLRAKSDGTTYPIGFLIGVMMVISLWYAAATAVSTSNLISIDMVLPFFLAPVILGTAMTFLPKVRDVLREIPTHWLVFIQAYRMAGGIFIFPYMIEGILTRGFSLNAGVGDVLTGILAVIAGYFVMRDPKRWSRGVTWLFYLFTIVGVGDLLLAMASAGIFGFNVEGVQPLFPITMIPLFYGPGLGVLMHMVTLRNFQLRKQPSTVETQRPHLQPTL